MSLDQILVRSAYCVRGGFDPVRLRTQAAFRSYVHLTALLCLGLVLVHFKLGTAQDGKRNEPHDVSWDVWLSGGVITNKPNRRRSDPPRTYDSVGMQKILDTVRATGAKNLVIA